MPERPKHQLPGILYSCYSHKSSEGEQFVPDHIFGYTFSGSSTTYQEGKNYSFKEGDFRFLKRNELTKYTKQPPPGGEYKSISIVLDQETLRSISMEHNLHMDTPYRGESVFHLPPNPMFKNYIDSLTPYLNDTVTLNKVISNLKVREAVMILLETNPALKNILFDFREPGKID